MNKNNSIQFDIKKWETGEYDAIYRNGENPIEILISKKAKECEVISVTCDGELTLHYNNGQHGRIVENSLDLFLTPKKKKGWVLVYDRIHFLEPLFFTNEKTKEISKKRGLKRGFKILHESEFEY
jgi:hypothetical protein